MPIYVNAVEIDDDAVFKEMQFHPAPTREEARDEAAKALVIQELLRQQAVEKGILEDTADMDTVEKAALKLMETQVTTPEADSVACRRYYDQNIERFRVAEGSKMPLPFDKVEHRIRDYLHTRSIRHGIQSYLLDLAGKAKIAGFDLSASL